MRFDDVSRFCLCFAFFQREHRFESNRSLQCKICNLFLAAVPRMKSGLVTLTKDQRREAPLPCGMLLIFKGLTIILCSIMGCEEWARKLL